MIGKHSQPAAGGVNGPPRSHIPGLRRPDFLELVHSLIWRKILVTSNGNSSHRPRCDVEWSQQLEVSSLSSRLL
jgi:hypothetical protein